MNLLKKCWNYYRNNGFINTLKAIYRKVFNKNIKYVENPMKNFALSLTDEEKKCSRLKNKKVFIFGTVPYYDVGGGQRSSQLSKIFNMMGYAVHYIYAFDSSESKIFNISMPLVLHKNIDQISIEEFDNLVGENDICIFEAPIKKFNVFLLVAKDNQAKVVYENIDNWETSLGSMFFDEHTLINMLKYSDMIVATAALLVEQTYKYFEKYNLQKKEVYYLANAVDDELFEPRKHYEKPKDLVQGEKTLIYYGSLWGEWFDWNLLEEVAKANPMSTINLIGDYKSVIDKKNSLPKNIHFLGLKKQIELPAYLVYSDYAILPFKCCDIGNYVSPLKIFEYIAMNKLVLSTNLPDIEGYPNLFNSNSASDWNKILSEDNKVDLERREEFVFNNNWYNRASKIVDVLFPERAQKTDEKFYNNISVVVLNYNNKNVIFRNIDTLLKFNFRYDYEIVVVDNNSTDGSYEELLNKYKNISNVKIVKNKKNGCSSGRNLGVSVAKNDYIVFLDSDEWILHKYWLDNYLTILNSYPEIGAIGWSAGWFNKQGFAYIYDAWFEHRYMSPNMLFRSDIGYLATCGFLITKELFDKVGGFDLFYDPTCYEDTDLALKVRDAGFEIVYSTYLGVGHLPHQTTKSGTDSHTKLLNEKGEYFVKKWKERNPKLLEYIK